MTDKKTKSNLHNKDDFKDEKNDEEMPETSEGPENKSSSKPAGFAEPDQTASDVKTEPLAGRKWYEKLLANKKISIPLAIVVLLLIILAVPFSRYKVLGLFWKQTYSLVVTDSQTNLPVSDAAVKLDGQTTTTDNRGHAKIKVPVGSSKLTVSKKYYKTVTEPIVVGLRPKANVTYKLLATGRQVPLKVVNIITDKPLSNIEVSATDTSAKTDKNGQVTIVLPADKSSVGATFSGKGFNNLKATITITSNNLTTNTFKLTPSGKIYFLSNASGKIDVVTTNLDGTNRQTVLAGTGNEDPQNTSLLASRDWKYLALQSIRDSSGNDQLNLIDTSNNQVTNIDEGNANFTPVGWSGDNFIYTVTRNDLGLWQTNRQSIKSFNAVTKKITILVQTAAAGSASDFVGQTIGDTFLVDNEIIYAQNWSSASVYNDISQMDSSGATLNSINPDGSNKKVIKKFFPAYQPNVYYNQYQTTLDIFLSPYDEPNSLEIDFYDGSQQNPYIYQNGQVSTDNDATNSSSNQPYSTYLESPSGNQTFWAEQRDGKNTLFVGDANGENGKQIASLSDYTTYGWYTENYLLVEKDGSELYIMPASGGTALKISDYYKPPQNFNGYGGGYGGL